MLGGLHRPPLQHLVLPVNDFVVENDGHSASNNLQSQFMVVLVQHSTAVDNQNLVGALFQSAIELSTLNSDGQRKAFWSNKAGVMLQDTSCMHSLQPMNCYMKR